MSSLSETITAYGLVEVAAEYTIRAIATNLITGTVTVSAGSKGEALAKAQQRISSKLVREGYEFQFEILNSKPSPVDRLSYSGGLATESEPRWTEIETEPGSARAGATLKLVWSKSYETDSSKR